MTIKYEALLGHLFVVGGRSISAPPPGSQVQVPPRRAHRSREQDTLFVLITPAGQNNARSNFYEELAALASDTYFKSRLGVTGALREAAAALNNFVQKTNEQQASDWRAGAIILVKRADEVYLMRAGTTLCVALRSGRFEAFPSDPDMLNMLPLGSRSEPILEFTHYTLAPNDIFILGDAGIAGLSDDILKQALATGDIETVLEQLEGNIKGQAFASVLQFIDPDAVSEPLPPSIEFPEDESETIPAISEAIVAETALTAPDTAAIEDETQVSMSTAEISVQPDTDPTEAAVSNAETEVPATTDSPKPRKARKNRRDKRRNRKATPSTPADSETLPDADALEDETIAAASIEPDATREKPKRNSIIRLIFVGILFVIASVLRSISNGINAILDRLLPEPEEGTRSTTLVPMNLVALVAVIVPALVAVVVVGVAISNRDSTEFEELRTFAIQAQDEALILEENPSAEAHDKRNAWIEVRTWAQRALNEYGESNDMRQLLLDAQNYINFYDNIKPTEISVLRTFQENSRLAGPIVGGQDIYTLDRNRGQVYRDTLDGSGTNIVSSEDFPIIELGRSINTYLVSNLVDIEWLSGPGVGPNRTNVLIALDDNGLLISYSVTFGLGAFQMQIPPEWQRPQAIALWDINLYVLDAGANQIWRFRPEDSFFQTLPEEYFTGNNRPDLTTAVDFGIEENGDIFILYSDGTISRFRGGDPINYELNTASTPVDGLNNGSALYVNNASADYALYIADNSNDAVYKISLGGTIRGGYRPLNILSETISFDALSGIYDDPQNGNIYILSGNTLYRSTRIVD